MTRSALQSLSLVLADVDPERLLAQGAPVNEYLPEAEALLPLQPLDGHAVRSVFRRSFEEAASSHSD